jgi:hypothetical protein
MNLLALLWTVYLEDAVTCFAKKTAPAPSPYALARAEQEAEWETHLDVVARDMWASSTPHGDEDLKLQCAACANAVCVASPTGCVRVLTRPQSRARLQGQHDSRPRLRLRLLQQSRRVLRGAPVSGICPDA